AIDLIFSIAVLIMSVVVHEVSHGYAAEALGDPTARYAGRLTLNPLKHLDPFGSFILPALTYFLGGFIFGWARPVPYNPYNLKNQKWGPAIVAAAGPISNIFLAVVFGLLMRLGAGALWLEGSLGLISSVVVINLVLAFFNLVPIPPLDGSKVAFAFLPFRFREFEEFLESWGPAILIFFVFFFFRLLLPLVFYAFELITGFSAV
ncbi:MAG: site-2 protease family protein, partial [Candidatus Niyogibacteria bacterium]|nr:site-2 protease family protein [Candidatus Niyogibacteria bacterium]